MPYSRAEQKGALAQPGRRRLVLGSTDPPTTLHVHNFKKEAAWKLGVGGFRGSLGPARHLERGSGIFIRQTQVPGATIP